jgi:hypothetical protein
MSGLAGMQALLPPYKAYRTWLRLCPVGLIGRPVLHGMQLHEGATTVFAYSPLMQQEFA